MFLVMASPVLANDNPFRDEVINELPPTLTEVKTTEAKTPFIQKVKDMFTRDDKDLAKEVEVVEPTGEALKTIDSVKKEQEREAKELKKQQKELEKAAKEAEKEALKAQKQKEKELAKAEKQAKKDAEKLVEEVNLVDETKEVVVMTRFCAPVSGKGSFVW